MATFNKFNSFIEDAMKGVHVFGTHQLKWVLTNSAPSAGNTVLANITQIANGNGYTTGGLSVTTSSAAQTGGTFKLVLADLTMTASGGSIGPFRYAVLINATASGSPLIGWYDYGSSVTLPDGAPFIFDADATTGVLQAA